VTLSVPRRLAHYEILNRIGEGGMGAVYLARDRRSQERVALKILDPELAQDAAFRARFLREAEYGRLVRHPNVVLVLDVGEAHLLAARRSLFLTMEHAPGRTLLGWMARQEIAPASAVRIAADVAEALGAAHLLGIVHRDVKPGNVLAAPGRPAKLVDFGLALRLQAAASEPPLAAPEIELTGPGLVGTLGYAPPEQILGGAVDARSDLFALGVVLYQLLTGRLPYGGVNPTEFLDAVGAGAAPLGAVMGRAGPLPAELEALVAALLQGAQQARPGSAVAVAAALRETQAVLEGERKEAPSRGHETEAAVAATTVRGGWLARLRRWLGG
jgi:serine/threonine-protein kinase